MLQLCTEKNIAYLPFFPLSVILPIPGTSSVQHLEENWEARRIQLSPDEVAAISEER